MTEKPSSQAAELVELANTINAWQQFRELSDTALCNHRSIDIGSPKTFNAIVAGNLEGYDVDRWLPAYRAAWNVLQVQPDAGDEVAVFEDLTPTVGVRAAMLDAMRERGNDRLIIVEGEPGMGKSFAVRALVNRFGAARIVLAEASEIWRDSINAMLSDLLKALGQPVPTTSSACMDKLIEVLKAKRVCLVIDEAHHMGPRGLNLVKSIINRSPGEVIMLGLSVLLKRLELAAYQEAKQLTLNRLSERIRLMDVDPSDAEKLMTRIGGLSAAIAREVGRPLAAMSKNRGALKFVHLVARRCRRDGLETADDVLKAAGRISNR